MHLAVSRRALVVAIVSIVSLALASPALAGETFVVDFFPEGQQINHTIQLRFFGPNEGTVTGARLVVDFTTAAGFDAKDLTMLLVAPIDGDTNFWFLTGEDLGWMGQGTFHADVSTTDIMGTLGPGLWANDIGSVLDPPAYSGTFSDTSHYEVSITPIPEPSGGLVALGLIGFTLRRKR